MKPSIDSLIGFLMGFFVLLLFPCLSSASFKPHEKSTTNFLVITDIHLDQSAWFTMTINPSTPNPFNDLDPVTFDKLITEVANSIKNNTIAQPQFILLLGDISGHSRWHSDTVVNNESAVFNQLKTKFPHTPIFYVFGNNDSLLTNYGPFNDPLHPRHNKSPYDIAKSKGQWRDGFLSTGAHCKAKQTVLPCLITEDAVNGYYAAYLNTKLRLIALNSVLFSVKRSKISESAATNELQWLATQLATAEEKHESILLAMHIPPGNNSYDHSNFWFATEEAAFLKLIKTHQHNLIGLLAGHTHAEELKILTASPNQIITGLYFTAALSTSHGNAPSVKTFYLSKEDEEWRFSDYKTFNFLQSDSKLTLNTLYKYKNYYCDPDQLSVSTCLNKVTAAKMARYFSAGNPNFAGVIGSPDDIHLTLPP